MTDEAFDFSESLSFICRVLDEHTGTARSVHFFFSLWRCLQKLGGVTLGFLPFSTVTVSSCHSAVFRVEEAKLSQSARASLGSHSATLLG